MQNQSFHVMSQHKYPLLNTTHQNQRQRSP